MLPRMGKHDRKVCKTFSCHSYLLKTMFNRQISTMEHMVGSLGGRYARLGSWPVCGMGVTAVISEWKRKEIRPWKDWKEGKHEQLKLKNVQTSLSLSSTM